MSEKHDIEVRLLSLAQGEKMRREGGIILDKKDIKNSGLTKEQLHKKILMFYQNRIQQGVEKHEVRVYANRRAIEIQFVGRSVVDADIISLQDYLSLPVLQALADGATAE